MTISTEDLLNSILESLDRIDYIKPEDIPNIDLYMDQVTTLMDSKLKNSTRNPEEDKILTKTMINNYAKNNLLPPPVKKKYSNEVFSLEKEQVEVMKKDLVEKFKKAGDTFQEAEEEERQFLQFFSFICMLSFDVYVKKLLIEKLLDLCGTQIMPKGKKGQPKAAKETAENGASGNPEQKKE